MVVQITNHGSNASIQIANKNEVIYSLDVTQGIVAKEFVPISNNLPEAQLYYVLNKAVPRDEISEFRIEVIENPDDIFLTESTLFSQASKLWYQDASHARATKIFGQIAKNTLNEQLREGATLAYVDALMRLHRSSEAAKVLESFFISNQQNTSIESLYIGLLYAISLRDLNKFNLALSKFEEIFSLASAQQSQAHFALLLSQRIKAEWGKSYIIEGFYQSDTDKMAIGYEKVASALRNLNQLSDSSTKAIVYSYLALHDGFKSTIDEAHRIDLLESSLTNYIEAKAIFESVGKNSQYLTVLHNIAFTYQRLGEIGYAQKGFLTAYHEAETLAPVVSVETISHVARGYKNNGDFYRSRIYMQNAINQIQEIQSLSRSLGLEDESSELSVLAHYQRRHDDLRLELGEIYRLSGNFQEAISLHKQVLESVNESAWREGFLRSHIELIKDYLLIQDLEKARYHADQLLQFREEQGFHSSNPRHDIDAHIAIAEMYLRSGNLNEAKNQLLSTLCRINKCELHEDSLQGGSDDYYPERQKQLQILHLLGLVSEREGNDSDAIKYGDKAIALINDSRFQLDITRQGAFWSANTDDIASWLVILLLEKYLIENDQVFLDLAFEYLQKTRGINFRMKRLVNNALSKQISDASSTRPYTAKIQAGVLSTAVQGEKIDELEEESIIRGDRQRIEETEPDLGSVSTIEILSLRELQEQLEDGVDTVMSIVIGKDKSYQLLVNSDQVQLVELPGESKLKEMVGKAFNELSNTNLNETDSSNETLSNLLLSWDFTKNKLGKLYWEGPGFLQKIAFASLRTSNLGGRKGYLGDYYQVLRVPSISTYFANSESFSALEESRQVIAVVADPDSLNPEEIKPLDSTRAIDFPTSAGKITPLNYTHKEINSIKSLYKDQASLFTGSNATLKNLFLPEVRSSRILHIASHAFSDEYNPQLTGLYLASDGKDLDSRFLTLDDLENQFYISELVVLSACSTARGEMLGSEGMLGLSRAFLVQGAKSTLSTLWPVSDRATADFISYFYDALQDPINDTASSLKEAQTKMRKNRRYRHPYYWAPFVLTVADRTAQPTLH